MSYSTKVGFSGNDTPVFENFFAGGYATLRGFDFRGASPVQNGIEVGGQFQWLNTVEYMFPITADDAFRGVAFVDFGTVEQSARIEADTFRVAPGLGLRVAIPMLGPAPLAFDFAYPVAQADTDQETHLQLLHEPDPLVGQGAVTSLSESVRLSRIADACSPATPFAGYL